MSRADNAQLSATQPHTLRPCPFTSRLTMNNHTISIMNLKHPGILLTLFCLLVPAITPLHGAEKAAPAGRGGANLTETISLDGVGWLLGLDPKNVGCEQKWFEAPRAEAKPATVPCAMQELFPISSGLAWYWKEFTAPANPHAGGKYLLRFWSVDYKADVWVNGKPVGTHLDGEEPFTLDVTAMVRSGKNLLAVRVLNPVESPIDGFSRGNTVAGFKHDLPARGWNFGGILDSVELLVAPAIRIEDLQVITDWKSGEVKVRGNIRNAGANKTRVRLIFSVAPAVGGSRIDESVQEQEVPAGDTALNGSVRVAQHRLWEPDDPVLYRVTARLEDPGSGSVDEQSDRVGFRDFRFEDGFFRLNGRRIFLRCAHSLWTTPTMIHSARDRETLRKDILYAKVLGFNTLRYLPYAAPRCQLELADELGLMILQQSMSSWRMGWPADPQARPTGAELFDRSLFGVVRRDRNHPSIVAWYFLNEHGDDPQFRHAAEVLPKVRELDDTRVCLLNSGRWDGRKEFGSASNPGSRTWDVMNLTESHYYPAVPHHPNVINDLRVGGRGSSHFLSEYGIGSALDLVKIAREFEQRGADGLLEAQYNRRHLELFMADWDRLRLAEIFGRPEDYFDAAVARNAGQRWLGWNALRSNPNLVAHSMTAFFDEVGCGEGPVTVFRDVKPGMFDALRDAMKPLRFCLFVEPNQLYRGGTVRPEVVLANEDVLKPGNYEVEVAIFDPNEKPIFKKKVTVAIGDPKTNPPFALPVLAETVKIDGPAGRYRLTANFVSSAAAAGRPVEFYVDDPATMPAVKADIAIWGKDEAVEKWLKEQGIAFHAVADGQPSPKREVIMVVGKAVKNASRFKDLASRIARGSTVVFLTAQTMFDNGEGGLPWWLPLARKGDYAGMDLWLYARDDWARKHPILDGLPCGGLMDWTFYRNIAPQKGNALLVTNPNPVQVNQSIRPDDFCHEGSVMGIEPPDEPVCGGINTCQGYKSGIYLGVWKLGAGRFIANVLNIRDNLGKDPVADRLLRNMLNYASQDTDKPIAELPANFDEQLKAMGYQTN